MILRQETLERLSKLLNLPFTGTEQDWDIEMADQNRIDEFIIFYNEVELTEEMKYATMSLIVASYDDFLNSQELDKDDRWDEIKKLLISEKTVFKDLIEYWAVESEEIDFFRVTPLLREVKAFT